LRGQRDGERFNTDRLKLEISRSRAAFLTYLAVTALGIYAFSVIFGKLIFQRPWDSYYNVKAVADDAKGVVTGKDQVRIAGVPVGVISQSQLIDGHAVLTLTLHSQYRPLYKNATVRLRAPTPLEDMYAQVTPGTPSAGAIPPNGTIPEGQTITPVDISRVLDTFDLDTRQRMTVLLSELAKGLGGTGGEQLKESFGAIAAVPERRRSRHEGARRPSYRDGAGGPQLLATLWRSGRHGPATVGIHHHWRSDAREARHLRAKIAALALFFLACLGIFIYLYKDAGPSSSTRSSTRWIRACASRSRAT
jgi:MlaD protein